MTFQDAEKSNVELHDSSGKWQHMTVISKFLQDLKAKNSKQLNTQGTKIFLIFKFINI